MGEQGSDLGLLFYNIVSLFLSPINPFVTNKEECQRTGPQSLHKLCNGLAYVTAL